MNFYKRFIGDIQAKTGGLTLAEFGAYDRLLDHYYSTEKPVPTDEVYRICRAMSAPERAAVDKVLSKFFDLGADGYTQGKADEVIAKAQPLIEAARANGKKGGRPRKENPDETQRVSGKNPDETQGEPSAKASQSQSQTPSLRSGEVSAEALGVPPQLLADWLVVRKAKRVGKLTETAASMLRREAGKAGLSVCQAVEACCKYGWGGFDAGWYADRQPKAQRTAPAARSFAESDREASMARWEQMTGQVHPDRQPAALVIDSPAAPAPLRIEA